jgi:hypothetical protein
MINRHRLASLGLMTFDYEGKTFHVDNGRRLLRSSLGSL